MYDVRSRLRDAGSDLLIRFGTPEQVIESLVKALQSRGDEVEGVWMQKEMTFQETRVEDDIEKRLKSTGVPIRFVHGKTLIHPADLPFEIHETPDVFTPFRKRVEALGPKMVRPCLPAPEVFKPFPATIPPTNDYALDVSYEVDVDGLSTRAPEGAEKRDEQISFHDILRYLIKPLNEPTLPFTLEGNAILQQRHHASAFPLRGGESSALERLEWYFVRGKSADSSRWGKADPPPVARYKQTRNNLIGHAYSTKMSPFLAYGSISSRQIWEALNYHEQKFGEDQNTYWVRFELLWRDYFFFVAEKFGDLLFHVGGFEMATDPKQAEKKIQDGWWKVWDPVKNGPQHEITRLLEGRTGIPFIDANILELRESGFMSNRGRQNVASFLSKDLGYDWRIGAEFFQSHLIDYDPTSNYGNWQYVAGVGNDPRASRQFNCIKQAKDYDSHGEYVKMWIPALRNIHIDYVHNPWLLDTEERRAYGLKTTEMDVTMDGYPAKPILEHESWQKHYERKEGVGSKMYGNPQEKVKDGKVKRYKKPITAKARAEGNLTNTMAPSFLPSVPQQLSAHGGLGGGLSYGRRNDTDYMSASSGTFGVMSGGQSVNVIPPLRGNRGSIGLTSQRSNSPFGNPPVSANSSSDGPPRDGIGSAGATRTGRGIVGGVLGSATPQTTANSRPSSYTTSGATGGSATGTESGSNGGQKSKADLESNWRRGT